MFDIEMPEKPRASRHKIFTLGFWNFLVATIALFVSSYTAWKQLRDINDITQVVYDIESNNLLYSSMKRSFSLVVYNSGTQIVALNSAYVYFVEHKLAKGKDKYGHETIEEHPVTLCKHEANFKSKISLKESGGPSASEFKATTIQKQEIKIIKMYYDLNNMLDYLMGYYSELNPNKPLEDFEGAFCLFTSYSSLDVDRVDIHERLFVGKFKLDDLGPYSLPKDGKEPFFIDGIPVAVYNHKQKVY